VFLIMMSVINWTTVKNIGKFIMSLLWLGSADNGDV
jgi:hypothetical protein